jgi:hypothetical protein
VPIPFRLKTAANVLALLAEQVAAVRDDLDVGTLKRARCIGYLAGVTFKAIEAGDMALPFEAVQGMLKTLREGPTPSVSIESAGQVNVAMNQANTMRVTAEGN